MWNGFLAGRDRKLRERPFQQAARAPSRTEGSARAVSTETVANMKQNLGFAFLYNSIGIPIAAGVLYPFTGILLSPMLAAAAMSLSSVSVMLNALRLRNAKV